MLSVELTYVSPPSLSSTPSASLPSPTSPSLFFSSLSASRFLSFSPYPYISLSLSNPFHTDAPSRPAWQEWWDVSTRYYTYPNILHCEQGGWVGGRAGREVVGFEKEVGCSYKTKQKRTLDLIWKLNNGPVCIHFLYFVSCLVSKLGTCSFIDSWQILWLNYSIMQFLNQRKFPGLYWWCD